MEIYKKEGKLVVEIPLKARRWNPFNEQAGLDPDTGEYDNIVGVIEGHHEDGNDYDEMGFMYTIDRDYKDKGDDVSDWCVKWHGDKEEFEELCKDLNIPLWYI